MRRRDLLRSVPALTFAGLSGCAAGPTDGDGGGSAGTVDGACPTPGPALRNALPDGDAYDRHGDVTVSDGTSDEGFERTAYALYTGPGGATYYFSVTEYPSPERAATARRETMARRADAGATLGSIRAGPFLYFAAGPGEGAVREFVAASALTEACLDAASLFWTPGGSADDDS